MRDAGKPEVSVEAWLAMEARMEGRHEYAQGEVFAMAGGSARHASLAHNLARRFGNALEGRPCRVWGSDLGVFLPIDEAFVYPDVTLSCGTPEFGRGQRLLNPSLVVEVLSASTEGYDRGLKFDRYRKLPSLTDYLLVSQHEPKVDHFQRGAGQLWLYRQVAGLDAVLELPNQGITLALAALWEGVAELPLEPSE